MTRRDHGLAQWFEAGKDGACKEVKTLQCVHCGGHFPAEQKVGNLRMLNYCGQCDGFICGPHCTKCVPVNLLLENIEAGRPDDYRPVQQSVIWSP